MEDRIEYPEHLTVRELLELAKGSGKPSLDIARIKHSLNDLMFNQIPEGNSNIRYEKRKSVKFNKKSK